MTRTRKPNRYLMKPRSKNDDVVEFNDNILVHSTKAGRLYIDPAELFARQKTQDMVFKLLESSISKQLELSSNQKK